MLLLSSEEVVSKFYRAVAGPSPQRHTRIAMCGAPSRRATANPGILTAVNGSPNGRHAEFCAPLFVRPFFVRRFLCA
ncbi:MAG: hypothetical protein HS128_17720 [Ideonella sp.]|nr:hypothetical protein [Ideonella sp.]MCC7459427.1 hypothetical protein [Nitrospira sp.]